MNTMLIPIFTSLLFVFIIFIALMCERGSGKLKIKYRYIISICLFVGIIIFSFMYNMENHLQNKKAEESKVVVEIAKNFKKNNKEVLTVKEQESLISDAFKNSSYLRSIVRVSFLEKSAVFIIKSIDNNDYFCKKTISELSELDDNKYKISINEKGIKDVINNKHEMKGICNSDKLTVIQVY